MNMRFFIALEIPDACRLEIEKVQQKIKKLIPEARLTDNPKLHLTLAFIGEQPEERQNQFTQVLDNAAHGIPPFSVTPAYLDGFPNLHRAHTLWMGVKGDIDKLFIIRERVKDGLIHLGLDVDDRRFVPHIALAKINNFHLQPFQEIEFEKIEMEKLAPIQINSLKLFESIPEEGFHRHNTLSEVPLSGNAVK